MRFQITEHKGIVAAIEAAGFQLTEFSFVKRRGKVHVIHEASKKHFAFHRKNETILDANNQWSRVNTYRIFDPDERNGQFTREEMLAEFTEWLANQSF